MARLKWNRGPWERFDEIWILPEDVSRARSIGLDPLELVWFSEYGWRREPFNNQNSVVVQGRGVTKKDLERRLTDV